MKNYWYELFEDNGYETKTIEICNTIKEARNIKKYLLNTGYWQKENLHIDKWTNKDNPIRIKEIE